jgi:LPS sulfotransferase NodH
MRWLRVPGLPPRAEDWIDRAVLDIRAVGGHQDYTKFVIVGIARTGSTMLLDLLNNNSKVLAFGEIFRRATEIGWDIRPFGGPYDRRFLDLYRSDPRAFLDRIVFGRWPRSVRAVGFKLFYYHAQEPPFSDVWQRMIADSEIRIIHLMRGNILAQFLSLKLAHRSDVWSMTRATAGKAEPIRLDPDGCARHFAEVRRYERECEQKFAAHPLLRVHYEDLVRAQDREMERVLEFLGITPESGSRTKLVRQRTVPLPEAIENFAELREVFHDTEWAGFFEVDPDEGKVIQ